jgi:hypothetical protein
MAQGSVIECRQLEQRMEEQDQEEQKIDEAKNEFEATLFKIKSEFER